MGLTWAEDITKGELSKSTNISEIRTHLDDIYGDLVAGVYGSGADLYSDVLASSCYNNCSWDTFTVTTLVDVGNTTMDLDVEIQRYDFTVGEVLQSNDLYDPLLAITVDECMVSIDYVDSGSPTIEVTADGTNWEIATNNALHSFTNTGSTLKLRFTAGGTGYIKSWAIFYNNDTGTTYGTSVRKYLTFNYEGSCQDEDTIIDGFHFSNGVSIEKITITSRVAPTGANLTIDLLKDGAEQSIISTLAAAATYEATSFTPQHFLSTDRFGLKIKSVGSTESGQSLIVVVHYYDR